ncbi:hypothetical protein [Hymenobacter rubidus]|uniref:hypothetical protein n=1 Tax=Hymenobacter rubidus TaxID=1441626 RepID=UPI00191ECD48|nr:hypothetical protein [Hymenobacter rubidus]
MVTSVTLKSLASAMTFADPSSFSSSKIFSLRCVASMDNQDKSAFSSQEKVLIAAAGSNITKYHNKTKIKANNRNKLLKLFKQSVLYHKGIGPAL